MQDFHSQATWMVKENIAQFNGPIGLAIDGAGNLYVGDTGNSRVRKISTSVVVSTLAANSAAFNGVTFTALVVIVT